MNGRKAKQLRKLAQMISVGKPLVQYQDKALNRRRPTARTRVMYECTRLVYKNLKRSTINLGDMFKHE